MTDPTPAQRLAAAYADQPEPTRERRHAPTFKANAHMDRLVSMPEAERENLLARSPALRISLGYYIESKNAYEQWKEHTDEN